MDIKERIIVACRDLSRAQGFHNVNMEELAVRAGVSKRTLYRYFPGKEAVIEATLDAFMAEVAGEVERILQSEKEPARILSGLLQYLFIHGQFVINPQSFNDLKQHYPHLWQKIDQFRLNRVRAVLTFINNNEGVLSQEIDPRIITAVILASIQAVLNPDFVLTNNLTFEETARQLSKLLMSAFIPA
ncbi:MAG: TetR/AcrR family transcriptional regulator [Syntrophomonas sp.]|nr:TetR/AcrR family transcriptional regulator [Syntrophomonas sp.]